MHYSSLKYFLNHNGKRRQRELRKVEKEEEDHLIKKFCQCIWFTCITGQSIRSKAEKIGSETNTETLRKVFINLTEGREGTVGIATLLTGLINDSQSNSIEELRWFTIIMRRGDWDRTHKINNTITSDQFIAFFSCRHNTHRTSAKEIRQSIYPHNDSRQSDFGERESLNKYGVQKRQQSSIKSEKKEESTKRIVPSIPVQIIMENMGSNYTLDRTITDTVNLRSISKRKDHITDERYEPTITNNSVLNELRSRRDKILQTGNRRHQEFLQSQSYLNRYTPTKSLNEKNKKSHLLEKIELSISVIKKQVQEIGRSSYKRTIPYGDNTEDEDIRICDDETYTDHMRYYDDVNNNIEHRFEQGSNVDVLRTEGALGEYPSRNSVYNIPGRASKSYRSNRVHNNTISDIERDSRLLADTRSRVLITEDERKSSRKGRDINFEEIGYTKSRGDRTERDGTREGRQGGLESHPNKENQWYTDMQIQEADDMQMEEYQSETSHINLRTITEGTSEACQITRKDTELHFDLINFHKKLNLVCDDEGHYDNKSKVEDHTINHGYDNLNRGTEYCLGLGTSMENILYSKNTRVNIDFTRDLNSMNQTEYRNILKQDESLIKCSEMFASKQPLSSLNNDPSVDDKLQEAIVFSHKSELTKHNAASTKVESVSNNLKINIDKINNGHFESSNHLYNNTEYDSINQHDHDLCDEQYRSKAESSPEKMNFQNMEAEFDNKPPNTERNYDAVYGSKRKDEKQETTEFEIRSLLDTKIFNIGSTSAKKDKIVQLTEMIVLDHTLEVNRRKEGQSEEVRALYMNSIPNTVKIVEHTPAGTSVNRLSTCTRLISRANSPINFNTPLKESAIKNDSGRKREEDTHNHESIIDSVFKINNSDTYQTIEYQYIVQDVKVEAEDREIIIPCTLYSVYDTCYSKTVYPRVAVPFHTIVSDIDECVYINNHDLYRHTAQSSFVRDLPVREWEQLNSHFGIDVNELGGQFDQCESFTGTLIRSDFFNLKSNTQLLHSIFDKRQAEVIQEFKEKQLTIKNQSIASLSVKRSLNNEFESIAPTPSDTDREDLSYKKMENIGDEISPRRDKNDDSILHKIDTKGKDNRKQQSNENSEERQTLKDRDNSFHDIIESKSRSALCEIKQHSNIPGSSSKKKLNISKSMRKSFDRALVYSQLEEDFTHIMKLREKLLFDTIEECQENYQSEPKVNSNIKSPQKNNTKQGASPVKRNKENCQIRILKAVNTNENASMDMNLVNSILNQSHSVQKLSKYDLSNSKSAWMHLNETDLIDFDKENVKYMNTIQLSDTKKTDDSCFKGMSAIKNAIKEIESSIVERDKLLLIRNGDTLNSRRSFSKFASTRDNNINSINYMSIANFKASVGKFSLDEKIYALENDIELDETVNHTEFVRTCIQNSCYDRKERALKIAANESIKKEEVNRLFEDSPNRHSELENYGSISSGSFEVPENEEDPMKINEFYVFFDFLVQIEMECGKIRDLLFAYSEFSLTTFVSAIFSQLKLKNINGEKLLHRKQMYKLARIFGCKSSEKKFNYFWAYRFRKAVITSNQFLQTFFNLKQLEYEGEPPADIKQYPQDVYNMLSSIIDLQVKIEIFFHKEKSHVSVMHIIDFIKRLTRGKREYLLFKDFISSPWFQGYENRDIKPAFRKFTNTELNQRINACNICVMLS